MFKRGDSVKQTENSTFRDHITEASLISFAGGRGEALKVEMPVFLRAARNRSEPVGCSGVGPGVRTSKPLHSRAPPRLRELSSDRRSIAPRFQTRFGSRKEGGCLIELNCIEQEANKNFMEQGRGHSPLLPGAGEG